LKELERKTYLLKNEKRRRGPNRTLPPPLWNQLWNQAKLWNLVIEPRSLRRPGC
jgi:hypothetical protein